ncbi:MAG: hypothetical protein LBK55_11755, partial [Azoarcus sp.]|nr:hypothetical protein [Azoarcus sp.]
AIDSFAGREDAVIKSLDDFRPKGVAGVTTLSNGQIVLILDMKEILGAAGEQRGVARAMLIKPSAAKPAKAEAPVAAADLMISAALRDFLALALREEDADISRLEPLFISI